MSAGTFSFSVKSCLFILSFMVMNLMTMACSHDGHLHSEHTSSCHIHSGYKTFLGMNYSFNELLNFNANLNSADLDKIFSPADHGRMYRLKTVVIDPGHGGKDAGCKGNTGSYEKNLTLEYAIMLGQMIEQAYPDITVVYTRKKDIFIELHERANIANDNKADLFISIHCNWNPNTSPYGTETYVLGLHRAKENLEVAKRENSSIFFENDYEENYDGFDPNSTEGNILLSMSQNAHLDQSISLAEKIEKEFGHKSGRKSRGVRQAGFLVLRRTAMPAVLIETGFLSNANEESYMISAKGKKEIVKNIFNGFVSYKQTYEYEFNDKPIAAIKEEIPDPNLMASTDNKPAPPSKSSLNHTKPINKTSDTPEIQRQKTKNTIAIVNAKDNNNEKEVNEIPNIDLKPSDKEIIQANHSNDKTTGDLDKQELEICVQLMVTTKIQDMTASKWSMFPNMIAREENNVFKYQAVCQTFEEAEAIKIKARNNGFPEAFVCAYSNGKRITLEEAKLIANK